VPFVVGPINGGVPWPKWFGAARRKEKEWLSYVRDAYKFVPGFWGTRRDAAAILVGSRDAWAQMPSGFHRKCFYVPENAIDPARFQTVRSRTATVPLRAIFVGRLVPYKGADMLLEAALPLLKTGKLTIDIIGDGPMMTELKALVARENVGNAVKLPGWVEHGQLQKWLAEADLFAFPSIREFGGAVVLEAMAVGVVPIIVDYGGPGELVTEKTGYRIPIGPREKIIENYRTLLTHLADDPSAIEAKSNLARRRAIEQFTWAAKAHRVIEVYQWVCATASVKPAFWMPTPDPVG
jgi:glycosyltransferase involved in cell wall biosynthesis